MEGGLEQALGEKALVEADYMKTRRGRMRLGAAAPGLRGVDVPSAEAAQEIELKSKSQYIERALLRWTQLTAASALSAWRFFTQTHQRMTKTATKVVGHWLHRTLALAYETWHEHAHAQARMRGILRRIAKRWLQRDVAVAFMSWKENADKQKRVEYITSR